MRRWHEGRDCGEHYGSVPVVETPQNVAAAERAMREMNAQYLTVIMEGKYTDWYLKSNGVDAPKFGGRVEDHVEPARLRWREYLYGAVCAG